MTASVTFPLVVEKNPRAQKRWPQFRFTDANPDNNSDCATTSVGEPHKPASFEIAKGIDPKGSPAPAGSTFLFTVTGCTNGGTPDFPAFSFSAPTDFGSPLGARKVITVHGASVVSPSCVLTELTPTGPLPKGCKWAPPRFSITNGASWVTGQITVPATPVGQPPQLVNVSNRLNCEKPEEGSVTVIKTVTPPDFTKPQPVNSLHVQTPPTSVSYPVSVTCRNSARQIVATRQTSFASNGGSAVFGNLPAGLTCEATEGQLPVGKNCSWKTVISPLSGVTVVAGGNAVLEVTNTYLCKNGDIAVSIPSRFDVIKQIDPASAPIPAGTTFPIAIGNCSGSSTPNTPLVTFAHDADFANDEAKQTVVVSGNAGNATCTVTEGTPVATLPQGCTWATPAYSTDGGATWSPQPPSVTGARLIMVGGTLPQVRVRNRLSCGTLPPSLAMTKTCVPNPVVLNAPGPVELTCTLTMTGSNLLPGKLITVTDTLTSTSGGALPVVTSVPVTNTGTQILGCAAQNPSNVIRCVTISDYLIAQGTLTTDVTLTVDNAWETGDLRNCVQATHQAFAQGSFGSGPACADIEVETKRGDDKPEPKFEFTKTCVPNPLEVAKPDDPATLRCEITIKGENLTPGQTINFNENLTAPGYGYAVSVASVNSLNPAIACDLVDPAPADIDCTTTSDAILAAGGELSGWISIVIENAGAPEAFQNCVGLPGDMPSTEPGASDACVTIPVVTPSGPTEPDPKPGGIAFFSILKELQSPCTVNRGTQTYTCDFGFDVSNLGDVPYQGPLVVTDSFTSGPTPQNVTLTGGKGWSCPGSDAAAATCLKGVAQLAPQQTDSYQMQVTLPGLREGGQFCNAASLGLGAGKFVRTIVVQEAMRLLGVKGGPSDGKDGAQTQAGVRELQDRLGFPATGAIDETLLTALGVPLGELARSDEVCAQLPPMPAPPLQCEAQTTRTLSETSCGCRYDGMTKRSLTSCGCKSGTSLKPGPGCVAKPRACPSGTKRQGDRCIKIERKVDLVCDAATTVKRGNSCECRVKGMRKVSETQCVGPVAKE